MNASNTMNVSTINPADTMKASNTMKPSKGLVAGFWIFTALFCLEMLFTAYYELLVLPQAAQAFTRLGFPAASFRVELSWAKVAGVAALLVPMVPARGVIYVIKEWAYAGFAINLVSALIAHLSIHDRPAALVPSATTSVLWALSYFFWRRMNCVDQRPAVTG
jgi:putative oxidoreductase